jgi:hypothetical protein
MKIYFANAEKSSHRSLLQNAGVTRFAVNLTHLAVPKKKELDLSVMFGGNEVILYTSENDEDVTRYDDFIRQHYESLTAIIGRPDYDGAWLNERYIPVWNDPDDMERLAYLCQRYGRAAISDKAVNGKTISRIRNLIQRWDAKLIGLSSKPEIIESLPWDSVLVGSWTSAVRYGETQVWDGHGLRRYPAQQKDSARKKHRADIIRLGIDYEQIVQDDNAEVAKLAIKSWQAWEQGVLGVYDPATDTDEEEIGLSDNGDNSNYLSNLPTSPNVASGGTSITIRGSEKRHEDDKVLLPVMGIEQYTPQLVKDLAGEGESEEIGVEKVPVIQYQSSLFRQCNSCYLSARCPAFKENAECGFKLPVEIKTKDQLQGAMRALLEMQVSRVLFARFAEELEGQGLDPALSGEVERLFNLVEKFKDISDTRDVMRLEVEARGSSGVLSRIFGQAVGESTRQLSGGGLNAQQTDRMYQDVIDLSDEA